ncbi:MAG: tetratricopeptide repeat protein [Anaeroplasmataceae bacterium]
MNKNIAINICEKYNSKYKHNQKEEEDFIEALKFLSDEGDIAATTCLGGRYYELKKFDLALKYYSIAASEGSVAAMSGLGYIYYYGRTAEPDYKKAFEYYKMAADLGDTKSIIKISDMYKNGYYVEKNLDKSYDLLITAYTKVKNDSNEIMECLPEIASRLGTILLNKGDVESGIKYMYKARDVLIKRITYFGSFWGDLTIMQIIEYNLFKYDVDIKYDNCIYNLFEKLKYEGIYSFTYLENKYLVEAVKEGDSVIVNFDDKWYKTIKDFFLNAKINGEKITTIASFCKLG